jgi:hypothetical protein
LSVSGPIISDLHGKRRVSYKNERALSNELHKLCREHDYTKRFEKALKVANTGLKKKGKKKRARTLAIKITRALDAKAKIRRAELVQHLQAMQYTEPEVDFMLRKLHSSGVLKCTVGKYSEAYIA